MSDYSKLKRLAEAAMPDDASPYLPCQVAFMNAATPAAVLALIAENEQYSSRLHDVATLCATVEQERDQLKAENERMRLALKSAEDAMWKSESNMDNEAADIRDLLAAMNNGEQANG